MLAFLSEVNAPIESIEGAQSILADISGFASDAVSFGISRIQDTASLLLAIILVPIFLFFGCGTLIAYLKVSQISFQKEKIPIKSVE